MKKIFVAILLCVFTFFSAGLTSHAMSDTGSTASEKKALIVGGTSGIGLSLATELKKQGYNLIIAGRHKPDETLIKLGDQDLFIQCNLNDGDISFLDKIDDINVLIFSAGFGRISPFSEISDIEIKNMFNVNSVAAVRTLKKYYSKIANKQDFNCAIITSIAADVSSPLFSLYSATKASLSRLIESVNIELEAQGFKNRILNVAPGYLSGTNFYGSGITDIKKLQPVAQNILKNMFLKKDKLIPQNEAIYAKVLDDYKKDAHDFGLKSYEYKLKSKRNSEGKKIKVGYLCGTFDLFHIGHLNILRNAKKHCDYLIVGVHKDASHKGKQTFIPLSERMDIVKNIKYVDECIIAKTNEQDVYKTLKYDCLLVGSDYKESKKFKNHEKYFADKGVEIIYLPYTTSTSSTQLRSVIGQAAEKSAAKNAS